MSFFRAKHMNLKLRKLGIQCFKRIVIQSWNKEAIADWSKIAQRAWQHNGIDFNSKLGLSLMSFLEKTTYSFEA